MEKFPLVSIGITSFNGATFIRRSIESVLSQTYKNVEVVFFDDASTDDTKKIIENYTHDERFRYERGDVNIGYTKSMLKLAELARGDFFQILGADDWLSESYVEEAVNGFLKYPDAACIASQIITLIAKKDHFFFRDVFFFRRGKISKRFF